MNRVTTGARKSAEAPAELRRRTGHWKTMAYPTVVFIPFHGPKRFNLRRPIPTGDKSDRLSYARGDRLIKSVLPGPAEARPTLRRRRAVLRRPAGKFGKAASVSGQHESENL